MRNFPPGKSQRAPIIVEPCSGGGPAKSQSDSCTDQRPFGAPSAVGFISSSSATSYVFIHTRGSIKMHPGVKDELACRGFVCRTLHRLGLNVETIKPNGRPAVGIVGATRACRLEEHQLTGADGCRSHRQWWLCVPKTSSVLIA
jgi:hypothetical protein